MEMGYNLADALPAVPLTILKRGKPWAGPFPHAPAPRRTNISAGYGGGCGGAIGPLEKCRGRPSRALGGTEARGRTGEDIATDPG